ncbi:MAG: adenylate/guanylate cyclase domain-containing protein [Paracoccaceae bacterium]
MAFRTVHPLLAAISVSWERDAESKMQTSAHGLSQTSVYSGSPMAIISQTRCSLRKDLTTVTSADHSAFQEHHTAGATDYYGLPLLYGEDHLAGILIIVSDKPGGLSEEEIAGFDAIARMLAPLSEVYRLRTLSTAVSTAYLGERSAQRVLGGQITRGHIERLNAAILISDIRGWTSMNTRLPAEEAVEKANGYFDLMAKCIDAHQGEILKFLGDGILAIFPADEDTTLACRNAMSAAQLALVEGDALDLNFGIGLHVGEVMYGNIGAETRLDFTVLGQAVNVAARVESMCKELKRTLLMSAELAARLDVPTQDLGAFPLKGLEHPTNIFTA